MIKNTNLQVQSDILWYTQQRSDRCVCHATGRRSTQPYRNRL